MNAYFTYLNDLINKHKIFYNGKGEINWLKSYDALDFQLKRDELLLPFIKSALFKGTKPFLNKLSKGCELCGKGLWSCLFITGKCNANCFYCPSAQDSYDSPQSQGLNFETPESYAEYILHFKFKGVGFSGGEPLLVKDKVLAYVKELRRTCDPDLYIWMYTNGILGTEEIFSQLAEAGLDEVRFDIGATGFKLDALAKARKFIKTLTIEIPAVPEETETLKNLLTKMVEAGVSNLNLHQMRLTPYNTKRLLEHNYTYVSAEQPIVLESELAALEIMNYANENNIPLGINYCSFFFKTRFQKAGFRKIIAQTLGTKDAIITEKGYIRLKRENSLRYDGITIADKGTLSDLASTLYLKHKSYDYQQSEALYLEIADVNLGDLLFVEPNNIPEKKDAFDSWNHEFIESGLRDY